MTGLAIETATSRVGVRVENDEGLVLAERVEDVGHGHTRRLATLVRETLAEAGVEIRGLAWIAADLGPGSFTGVRVGLATAQALALVAGAELRGASSLAALAHAFAERKTLIVPLVGAGRRDVYAGFFRTEARGDARLVMAPCVGPVQLVLERTAEAVAAVGDLGPTFIGPGAEREREALESVWPGRVPGFRSDGLAAGDLAVAARRGGGAALGLPAAGQAIEPAYVRGAQAEDRVRRRALASVPILLRPMTRDDVPAITEIEQQVFPDPWPASAFDSELRQLGMFANVAEREGRLAGYSLTWLGGDPGHLGNLAVAPDQQRRGVAAALLDDLLGRSRAMDVQSVTLEVRVSNDAAQALYRGRGFRVAGLRRRYYRDDGEDALIMEWRA